ncbi:MAG: hypothetical protein ACLQSR_04160 [Limisphaerales bacterium]
MSGQARKSNQCWASCTRPLEHFSNSLVKPHYESIHAKHKVRDITCAYLACRGATLEISHKVAGNLPQRVFPSRRDGGNIPTSLISPNFKIAARANFAVLKFAVSIAIFILQTSAQAFHALEPVFPRYFSTKDRHPSATQTNHAKKPLIFHLADPL